MKLQTTLVATIVHSQFDHIKLADPNFLRTRRNYLRKVIVYVSKMLSDKERCWAWGKDFYSAHDQFILEPKEAVAIFILMITESAKELSFDADRLISEIDTVPESSLGFVESVEALIQTSLNHSTDYQSLFRILQLAGISENTFYAELIAHFALTRFRIQKGYMGVRVGSYLDQNESRGWNDALCAAQYAYAAGITPNALHYVINGLE